MTLSSHQSIEAIRSGRGTAYSPMVASLFSHVILDVDDVILRTQEAIQAGTQALREALVARLGPSVGGRVADLFSENHATMVRHFRRVGSSTGADQDVRQLKERMQYWQRSVVKAGFEVKQWSRDTFLAIALERAGCEVTAVVLDEALRCYWTEVAAASVLYPDAGPFFVRLRELGIPYHLATGSDGTLYFDDSSRGFTYDPERCRARKLGRLKCLAEIGIREEDVSVGDPHGKPSFAFFERVLNDFETKIGAKIDRARTVAIGDSYTDDIEPLLRLGVGRGAVLVRPGWAATGPAEAKGLGQGVGVLSSLMELVS